MVRSRTSEVAADARLRAPLGKETMHLIVGIPAYDEARTIADLIGRIPRTLDGVDRIEVLVVDDGSSDGTDELARQAGATVVRHASNHGVGVAFQSIYRFALQRGADLLVTMDGDGQFDPADIATLIAPVLAGKAEVATASRFIDPALVPVMPAVKKWGNRRVAGLVNRITGLRFADVSCGFRCYSANALFALTVYHSYTYTHETFIDLATKRVPIVEVPVRVRGVREFGESRVAGSVLRYAWQTGGIMLRTYRDYQPLKLCAWLAVPPSLLGVALLLWSLLELQLTGRWLKAGAFAGAAFLAVAVASLFFGFMADIASRLRRNQEELIYWQRRGAHPRGARVGATPVTAAAESIRPPGRPAEVSEESTP